KGGSFQTGRHTFTIGASGLPEPIEIHPDPTELALVQREGGAQPAAAELRQIGRGPQLRSPIRIEARIAGRAVPAEVTSAVRPALKDGVAACSSKMKAGPVSLALDARYEPDGSLRAKLTYSASGAEVESLELVLELDGPVDLVIPGEAVSDKVQAYVEKDFTLSDEEGLVWGNAPADAAKGGRAAPGIPQSVFVGSGDRGFTFLTDPAVGWDIDKAVSTTALTRDKAGHVSWRIKFVNRKSKLAGEKTLRFALLTHPASSKAPGHRAAGMLDLPFAGGAAAKVLPLSLEALAETSAPLLRADSGAVFEALSDHAVLTGPAGGDPVSAATDHVATYPIRLFRYLAGTHTHLTVQVRSDVTKFVSPGSSRSADRAVIGRALLHDVGFDPAQLAHLADVARALTALQRFGYFETDGQTEFIPYWRSARIARYGQKFEEGNAFNLTEKNPAGKVYVSLYRRPWTRGKPKGYKVLFVIANESDQPIRDLLYIEDPRRILGGHNALQFYDVAKQYKLADPVARSPDWDPAKFSRLTRLGQQGINMPPTVLSELETGGMVRQVGVRGDLETYGPIFIPAHDYRILYAHGHGTQPGPKPGAPQGEKGR
ncbi:MAG TPA: hypothetical protein VMZ50_08270, partial [Phycisphaerae bacterium]|nr:hypothetical protein [Phycisphaerae bacterium]